MAHCSCSSSLARADAAADAREASDPAEGFVGDCLSALGEDGDAGDAPAFCWKKDRSVGVAPLEEEEAVAEALGRCLRLGAGDGAMAGSGSSEGCSGHL